MGPEFDTNIDYTSPKAGYEFLWKALRAANRDNWDLPNYPTKQSTKALQKCSVALGQQAKTDHSPWVQSQRRQIQEICRLHNLQRVRPKEAQVLEFIRLTDKFLHERNPLGWLMYS